MKFLQSVLYDIFERFIPKRLLFGFSRKSTKQFNSPFPHQFLLLLNDKYILGQHLEFFLKRIGWRHISIHWLSVLVWLLNKIHLNFFQVIFFLSKIFKLILHIGDSFEKISIVFLSVQKAVNKIFAIFDISATSDLMIGCFNLCVLPNHDFHFIFEESLEELVDKTNIDPFFFFLQFLAHGFHHNLFDFLLSFLSFYDGFMSTVESIIECVYFVISFILLTCNCSLYWLEHISALITQFGFVKVILPQCSDFNTVFF